MIARESSDLTKQESSTSTNDNGKNFKGSSSSTTTSWSRLKDPRIVRVSRAFGGKDRHSKVCTVRGLRDRRVRLSVPTAIQLYDLQDRLGLNQPSKVVDWLLNAAKNEIDELPPLQIPPGTFNPTLLPMLNSHEIRSASQSNKHGLKIGAGSINWNDSSESKDVSEGRTNEDQERQFNLENNQDSYVRLENNPSSSLPAGLMNAGSNSMSYNSFARWDSSNLTLSQPPRSHGLSAQQHEDWHNFSLIPLQPTVSLPPSGSHHQVLVYQTQPGMSTHSYFPTQIGGSNTQLDLKQLNFQRSELSSSPLSSPVDSTTQPASRQIHFNMTANLLPSQNND